MRKKPAQWSIVPTEKCPYTETARTVVTVKGFFWEISSSTPPGTAMKGLTGSGSGDEALMNAAMQFNSLVNSGMAVACDDEDNTGFISRYRR